MGSRYIEGVNTDRIRWALEDVNTSPEAFGETAGIKDFAEKLATGRWTYNQIRNVADRLGYGVLFFMESGLPEAKKVHTAHYRTLANQRIPFDHKLAKLVKQAERHRAVYIETLEELREEEPPFQPPVLRGGLADKAAAVRKWLKLSAAENYEFADYRKRLSEKNILILQGMGYKGKWRVEDDKIHGLSICYKNTPVIFVAQGGKQRRTFTLFHELAHLLLHRKDKIDNADTIYDKRDRQEIEANRFAGLCLLPDELLNGVDVPGDFELFNGRFGGLARKLGISVEVVVRRLADTRRISNKDYESYVQWRDENRERAPKQAAGTREYRHREPLHIFGDRYVRAILSGLEAKIITLNKASNYLDGLKITDIRKLEGYCLEFRPAALFR